jgi:acyl-CoA synthetase (AMP-forming)/AMP-acid ligase II
VIATVIDAGDGLPLTVPALLRQQVERHGPRVLLTCDDDVLTYAEADRRSRLLARGLLALGAGKGTHVGLLHPNGSDFVTTWLAAARIGAVSVPLSTFSTGPELRTLLRSADVEILLGAASHRARDLVAVVSAAVPEVDLAPGQPLHAATVPALRYLALAGDGVPASRSVATVVERGWDLPDGAFRAAEAAVDPSDRMAIVHTSGSTGAPKGAVHCHGALLRHVANLNELRRYTPDEVLFANSPFFWIGGFAYTLLGTLLAGARLVCSNAPTAAGVLDVLERERPTMVNGYVQAVAHLPADPTFAGRDLSSIRRGNLYPILPDGVRPADPQLRHQMLGMTEAGSVCLLSEDEGDQPEARRGSFGRPAPGFEARVVDPATGATCAPGEVGELWLRGPFMMEGYYGCERHEAFDADGWYHSGDLFAVDADGFFYFKGRRGDLIKTAGADVSPSEVEAAIREVCGLAAHVVGLADPDRGQIVAAAVRVPAGDPVPDPDGLRRRLAEQLSAYKVPRRIVLLADHEVPATSSGKVDFVALKERLRGAG